MDARDSGLLKVMMIVGAAVIVLSVTGAAGLSAMSARLQGQTIVARGPFIDPETTGGLPPGMSKVVLDPCTGQPRH